MLRLAAKGDEASLVTSGWGITGPPGLREGPFAPYVPMAKTTVILNVTLALSDSEQE
jgi:hypothetical protein